MTVAWRLCKEKFASSPLDGEGARRVGGRWGPPGIAIAYCSSSLALAALEVLVHFDIEIAPADLVAVRIEFSAGMVENVAEADLPRNWRDIPSPQACRLIKEEWATSCRSLVLRVPSIVIPEECNYLINPMHRQAPEVKVDKPRPFVFDPRLR